MQVRLYSIAGGFVNGKIQNPGSEKHIFHGSLSPIILLGILRTGDESRENLRLPLLYGTLEVSRKLAYNWQSMIRFTRDGIGEERKFCHVYTPCSRCPQSHEASFIRITDPFSICRSPLTEADSKENPDVLALIQIIKKGPGSDLFLDCGIYCIIPR